MLDAGRTGWFTTFDKVVITSQALGTHNKLVYGRFLLAEISRHAITTVYGRFISLADCMQSSECKRIFIRVDENLHDVLSAM